MDSPIIFAKYEKISVVKEGYVDLFSEQNIYLKIDFKVLEYKHYKL